MRVLFVHDVFGSFGGAETNILNTARELKRRAHQLALAARRRTGLEEDAWRGVFDPGLFFPVSASDWREVLQTARPELVYLHNWADQASIDIILGSGLPLVRMVLDHDLYCLRRYKYNPVTRRICPRPAGAYCVFPCLGTVKRDRGGPFPFKWVSYRAKMREIALNRRFDRLLTPSDFIRHELLINGFLHEQVISFPLVPPPIEPQVSDFGPRNLLIYAGQITRGKGVDVMLRALARVHGPFEALILGDGHYRSYCERLARRLGLQGRVKFLGFVSQLELRRLYAETTAFLIPSVWPEPSSLVGVEVMRYALPVVAFDVGGIGEWLEDGENGYLVDWMDVGAFAARVDALLKDKERARRMGQRSLERVTLQFDFDRYISGLEDLFRSLIAGKGVSGERPPLPRS